MAEKTCRMMLVECSAPHWPLVVDQLRADNIEPIYWSAWSRIQSEVARSAPNAIFHDTALAKRGLDSHAAAVTAGEFDDVCARVWREDAQIVYDQMNRFDHSCDQTFHERQLLFYEQLTYWRSFLKSQQPDLIVFPAPPHVVYDYIIYRLARTLGIQTLMFEEATVLPPYSLHMHGFEEGSKRLASYARRRWDASEEASNAENRLRRTYSEAKPVNEIAAAEARESAAAEGASGFEQKVREVSRIDTEFGGTYERNDRIVNEDSIHKERGVSLRESFEASFANTRFMKQLADHRAGAEELARFYDANCATLPERKYIYVPLAGQPERTTNPQADIFTSQLLMVNLLAKAAPSDWLIAVKEHPNQSHPNFAVLMDRSKDFYRSLKRHNNVVLLSTQEDPFKLLDRSVAVATTGGTTGLEAIARGKRTLLFGNAWYRDCPGIIRVRTLRDSRRAMAQLLNGVSPIAPGEFENYLEAVKQSSFRGMADVAPATWPATQEETVDNLVTLVRREIASLIFIGRREH